MAEPPSRFSARAAAPAADGSGAAVSGDDHTRKQRAECDQQNRQRQAEQSDATPFGAENGRGRDRHRRQPQQSVARRNRQRQRDRGALRAFAAVAADRPKQRRERAQRPRRATRQGRRSGPKTPRSSSSPSHRQRSIIAPSADRTRAVLSARPAMKAGGDDHQAGRIDLLGKAAAEQRCRAETWESRRRSRMPRLRPRAPETDGNAATALQR